MSNDMSMFKKMKERITDEVNSATNKLQNMQLIDQLASIGQAQIKSEATSNQLGPGPHKSTNYNEVPSRNTHFSIIDDEIYEGYNGEDEPMSPQHQLFNEHSIVRLNTSSSDSRLLAKNGTSSVMNMNLNIPKAVIGISELSSDLEDGIDNGTDDAKDLDVEIDLLSDNHGDIETDTKHDRIPSDRIVQYKMKYKNVVHNLRETHRRFEADKEKLEKQKVELANQLATMKAELDNIRQNQQNSSQHDSLLSVSTNASENDKVRVPSPQPVSKSGTKLRDLERLLAKCKESLKTKNSQIKVLKDSLSEFEKFKDINQDLRRELGELREAHESWTVSIAENKRVMHQEIENKNAEFDRLKGETNDFQNRLTESLNKNQQLRSALQDLESRLVSTSAAHQKERESLTKELTASKNNALRQVQKEYEHTIERVKLDLEKTIESLKLELLNKDEQIIKSAERQQELHDRNSSLNQELEQTNKKVKVQVNIIDTLRENIKKEESSCADLKAELDALKNQLKQQDAEYDSNSKCITKELESLREKVASAEQLNLDLKSRLDIAEKGQNEECANCKQLQHDISVQAEKFQQELHELSTKLDLMSTANDDQEKAIKSLQAERDSLSNTCKSMKHDFDELLKKNESLSRVLKENETDMQAQQEQLDQMTTLRHELDCSKKENSSLAANLSQLKLELNDRIADLNQMKSQNDELASRLAELEDELNDSRKQCDDLKKDKESLNLQNESVNKQKRQLDEQLVVGILAAMKNLETPTQSPGSDKSYDSNQQQDSSSSQSDRVLPDPMTLMEELSSVALGRCQAYLTTSQRLQAVLLENQMIGEELNRLKEELQTIQMEKNLASQCSIEETEKLHTENQALIHDQQAYDERIACLEDEIEALKKKLLKETAARDATDVVPDSTQFEYLKNIVHQFMLGKEPLVLARVISAVFKFDKDQVDQICKVQEAVQLATRQNIK